MQIAQEKSSFFFGEFLKKNGMISAIELKEALGLMKLINLRIGDLAVANGLLTEEQATWINHLQRWRDCPFGELAVAGKFITEEDLCDFLKKQEKNNIRIGEAVVSLGYLSSSERDVLLQQFYDTQFSYRPQQVALDDKTLTSPINYDIVSFLVDFLPRFSLRTVGRPIKTGASHVWNHQKTYELQASVIFKKKFYLGLSLGLEMDFAEALAAGFLQLDRTVLERAQLSQALGDFLKMLIVHTLSHFGKSKPEDELLPISGVLLPAGVVYQIGIGEGEGIIVIDAEAE